MTFVIFFSVLCSFSRWQIVQYYILHSITSNAYSRISCTMYVYRVPGKVVATSWPFSDNEFSSFSVHQWRGCNPWGLHVKIWSWSVRWYGCWWQCYANFSDTLYLLSLSLRRFSERIYPAEMPFNKISRTWDPGHGLCHVYEIETARAIFFWHSDTKNMEGEGRGDLRTSIT